VTTFFIEEEIDTGMIIDQQSINIDPDENVGSVYSRLQHLGSCVLAETVQGIMEGTISPVPQDTRFTHASDLRPAPKISKQTCQISWNKTAREVHNLVRGFSPYPAAWTYIGLDNQQAEMVKIYATRPIIEKHVLAPGTIITDAKSFLNIATLDGYISVMEIQPAAKKKMDITAYLNGHHIDNRSKAF
jgi:methionyl-tRNA formyltransferase